MPSVIHLRAGITAVFVLILTLTGCSGVPSPAATVNPDSSTDTLAIVAGARQNQPALFSSRESSGQNQQVLNLPSLGNSLHEKLSSNATVTVIPADGVPAASQSATLTVIDKNPKTRSDSIASNVSSAAGLIASARASVTETNTLAAIDVAGRAGKTVFIVDSGVSTTGPLALQTGLLSSKTDVNSLIRQLEASGNQPHFNGTRFIWWGLGQVTAPQPALPIWARTKLQQLWEAVITAGGGTVVFNHEQLTPGDPASPQLPHVTPVDFTDTPVEPLSLTLPETRLHFQENVASFADVEKAKAALAAIAPALNINDHPHIWITGCTALDPAATAANMKTVSRARAEATAKLLRELGATSALHVEGYGPHCPGRISDLNANGLLTENAALNRKVLITSTAQQETPAQ
ncbi:hypothetical protein [Arthrobacter sp. OY3WO11]|uniref:hypothetical protein n=1 Tax=Arthrobacter sp. OY3WO11 TaxID=1835723 RepID=UPI0007CFC059|nr:hypothetical protein [Arthrobacter sp. OY3WO11]OAD97739.1 hypothetical protein A6A22_20265 [Arthrobacter sp. OY3WO11]